MTADLILYEGPPDPVHVTAIDTLKERLRAARA